MNVLITGAKGFVGRNLCETLKTIKDGRNKTRCHRAQLMRKKSATRPTPEGVKAM